MPTYRSILKKTLLITLKNKKLLYFGFFLALLGNGGETNLFINNIHAASERALGTSDISHFFMISAIGNAFVRATRNLIGFRDPFTNFFLILAFAALIYIIITAQGALIASVYNAVKKNHRIQLAKTWRETRGKFFELLAANIIFKGGGLAVSILISMPFFLIISSLTPLSFKESALIVGALVFTPLAIIVSFLTKYTLLGIVSKNQPPLSAFQNATALFRENWLITIENALLLFFLNFALGFVTWILAVLVSFPIIATLALTVYPLVYPVGHYATIIAWTSIVLIAVLGSALSVFQYTSWTILYTRLTAKRKFESKIVRIASRFIPL